MDTFEMAPRLHFSVAEFRFALGGDSFFGVADFFLALLVQSDLILGTLASFGSKYTAGGFLHGWALKCTTGSAFALSLVWIFLFGLLVVFDQVGQVYRRPRCACWGQSKAWKLFPGLVLVSSEGSHLLHSQPRGQSALSLEHHALQVVGCYFQLSRGFSLSHLHLVDGAPVLGVLDLGVGRVDDLVVVVKQLLADRALGVEVLRIRKILIIQLQLCAQMKICLNTFFSSFLLNPLFIPGRWPWQDCPSPTRLQSEKRRLHSWQTFFKR